MQEGEHGRKVGLEEIEDRIPDLGGQDRRIEHVECGSGAILCGGRGDARGLSRPLSLGAIPIIVPFLALGQRGQVSLGRTTAHSDGGGGIYTFSTGGFTGAAGGIDAGVDTFYLASTATSAGDTGSHCDDRGGRERRDARLSGRVGGKEVKITGDEVREGQGEKVRKRRKRRRDKAVPGTTVDTSGLSSRPPYFSGSFSPGFRTRLQTVWVARGDSDDRPRLSYFCRQYSVPPRLTMNRGRGIVCVCVSVCVHGRSTHGRN